MGHTNGLIRGDGSWTDAHWKIISGLIFPIDLIIHIARSERSLDETSNLELDQLLVETS
jgi:hypothetical protein